MDIDILDGLVEVFVLEQVPVELPLEPVPWLV